MQLTPKQKRLLEAIKSRPVDIAHKLGFTKLEELHNRWIVDMIHGGGDKTLQAHRGSYKTTCVSIALALIMLIYPNDKTLFMRKTDTDVAEIVKQVKKILQHPFFIALCFELWGVNLLLTVDNATELSTSLPNDPRGTSQLVAIGCGSSITGKHFDRIFTDDIINKADRFSRAEREKTKLAYQELQNIKNREVGRGLRAGRIYNTGTPWHQDDAFSIMPPADKYDVYTTGLISEEEQSALKARMTPSLWAANYELRHIASDKVIFTDPTLDADPALVEQGSCHIDASYGGEDYTAFTICRKANGKYYVLGKLWQEHVDDVKDEIIAIRKSLNAGRISCEKNGDKGYLAKELQSAGERTHCYHENMNKHLKITSYLKAEWPDVVFVAGTDDAYIAQILEYTEEAEHDDAPDSLASIIRELWRKKPPKENIITNYLT